MVHTLIRYYCEIMTLTNVFFFSFLCKFQSKQTKVFLHWLLVIIDQIKSMKLFGCSIQKIPKLQNVDIYMQNVHSI